MTLAFRRGLPADVHAVAALIERAYRQPDPATAWTDESALLSGPRTSASVVGQMLDSDDVHCVVAEDDGALVGSAMLERTEAREAHFGMFGIEPDRQGGGVGRVLLAECERMAVELWSTRLITMHVISLRTELIAWYARRGYLPTGAREPFEHVTGACARTSTWWFSPRSCPPTERLRFQASPGRKRPLDERSVPRPHRRRRQRPPGRDTRDPARLGP